MHTSTLPDRKVTKLYIPHRVEENCTIVGTLEQLDPGQPTAGRKIALLLHGIMGHKDYLFLKLLADRLPMDSFRFDFRGHHESSGTWRHGTPGEGVVDLIVVVEHLKKNYGYEVDLLVAHSRGAIVAFHWLCTSEEGKNVSGFVNVSGRYRMRKTSESPAGAAWKAAIDAQGSYEWKTVVAGNPFVGRIYARDLEEIANWDTSLVWHRFPAKTDVLTLHGLLDKTVSPYDALIYAKALGNRTPGTHNLEMVEDADHNFTGRKDDVVDTILEWWRIRQTGNITTGIWMTGTRGRL